MERTWTKVGREVFEKSVDEGGHDITRKTIVRAIEQVEWRAVGTDGRLANVPMMPAHGIMAAIQECRIPKVSHIAWSNQLAPNGFYAIRAALGVQSLAKCAPAPDSFFLLLVVAALFLAGFLLDRGEPTERR